MMRQLIVILTLSLFYCGAMAGTWKVMQDNKACLLADMELAFTVAYTGTNDTMKATFDLPSNATVVPAGSSCGEKESSMTLGFYDDYSMLFKFAVMANSTILNYIEFHYTQDSTRFPDAQEPNKPTTMKGDYIMFKAPVGDSYRCNSNDTDSSVTGLVLVYSNVKLQPFGVANGTFSKEHVCTYDLTTTEQPTTTAQPTTSTPTTTNMTTSNMTTVVFTTIIDNTNTTTIMATTTPLVTTTPKPPTEGNWTVKNGNKTCMNMAFKANFTFFYDNAKNKSVSKNVMLPIDADASSSSCPQNRSTFILKFSPFVNGSAWRMTMVFDLINSTDYTKTKGKYNAFQMTELNVTYSDPMGEEEDVSKIGKYFETKLDKTYKCDAGEVIRAGNMNVTFADVKFQPFADGSKYPGELQDCKMDDKSSNIVPIAVGCALAGLVVIVLIAYLIGRKRTKSVGYQTV